MAETKALLDMITEEVKQKFNKTMSTDHKIDHF